MCIPLPGIAPLCWSTVGNPMVAALLLLDKRFFKTLSPLVFFFFPSYPYLSLLLVAETVDCLCTLTLFISLQGKTELSFLTHCQSLSSSNIFHLIFFSPCGSYFFFQMLKVPFFVAIFEGLFSFSALLPALKPLRTCLCFPLLPCFALCPLCSATAWTQAPSCSASEHLKNTATASPGRRINMYRVTCSGLWLR